MVIMQNNPIAICLHQKKKNYCYGVKKFRSQLTTVCNNFLLRPLPNTNTDNKKKNKWVSGS